jgi:hypothetical protein
MSVSIISTQQLTPHSPQSFNLLLWEQPFILTYIIVGNISLIVAATSWLDDEG